MSAARLTGFPDLTSVPEFSRMTEFQPHRRRTLKLAAATLAAPALLAQSPNAISASRSVLDDAVLRFGRQVPATSSCLVVADVPNGTGWTSAYEPDRYLFVGSAVKTFILAQFLIDAETGRNGLSGTKLCDVNDSVRTPGSPVLIGLSGQTPYRTALESMIAHSDNISTDIALAAVGPQRVRDLIRQAQLNTPHVPDSTRILFSYLAGAAPGTDLGWAGMQKLARGDNLGLTPRRDVINDKQTMTSSATDLVNWYRAALGGRFFHKQETLLEFKRISAMADAAWMTVPDGLPAYGKGGSLDWENFHALCFAAQMLVGKTRVTFCFTWNWLDGKTSVERTEEFIDSVRDVLISAADAARP